MTLSRRELLASGSLALAAASLAPSTLQAQAPKRGGTLNLRTWDPPHFDHMLTISYKTHIPLTFAHSRLLKHWEGAVKNYGPNLGYDYGGRLMAAWLER
jgi:hypothetical protein